MKQKNLLVVIVLISVVAFGLFLARSKNTTPSASPNPTRVPLTGDVLVDMKQNPGIVSENGSYVDYSSASFDGAQNKKRVYFFHASWCPTCKAANIEFNKRLSEIPRDVVLFKTDYDTQAALKKKYGITYQHTFVQVDAKGKAVSTWNGGDIAALLSHLK